MPDTSRPDVMAAECEDDGDCPNEGCSLRGCNVDTGLCEYIGDISCEAPDACSEFLGCDESGCLYALLDADGDGYAPAELGDCGLDCNDDDPGISPEGFERCDGVDQDCDSVIDERSEGAIVCGADLDDDGHGSSTDFYWDCRGVCDPDRHPSNDDCWDGFDDFIPGVPGPFLAHPGQMIWFQEARDDGSFDWNCDTIEEKQTPEVVFASCGAPPCAPQSGWAVEFPACGEDAAYVTCQNDFDTCRAVSTRRFQSCR